MRVCHTPELVSVLERPLEKAVDTIVGDAKSRALFPAPTIGEPY